MFKLSHKVIWGNVHYVSCSALILDSSVTNYGVIGSNCVKLWFVWGGF